MWDSLFAPGTIALVGNGPVDASLSDEIDRHDRVLRMNSARLCGKAGKRTDILVLNNIGYPGRDLLKKAAINPSAIRDARAVWFVHTRRRIGKIGLADHTDELRDAIGKAVHCRFISTRSHLRAQGALIRLGMREGTPISTGVGVVAEIMRRWPSTKTTLYGFTHEGWKGHDWDAERRWIDRLSRDGFVRRSLPHIAHEGRRDDGSGGAKRLDPPIRNLWGIKR